MVVWMSRIESCSWRLGFGVLFIDHQCTALAVKFLLSVECCVSLYDFVQSALQARTAISMARAGLSLLQKEDF